MYFDPRKPMPGLPGGIPLDLLKKEAPDIEKMLNDHIELVTKSLGNLNDKGKSNDEKIVELGKMMADLSQQMALGRKGTFSFDGHPQSWGDIVANDSRIKDFAASDRPDRLRIDVKAITSANAAAHVVPELGETLSLPRRRLFVRDLVNVRPTASGVVQYPRQTVRDNAATPVAEGDLKPESNYGFELKEVKMRTIAHWVEASRQILEDSPQLAGLINDELLYGLAIEEEKQILLGAGVGQTLPGIIPGATAYLAPFTPADMTMIDQIGLALLQSSLTDVEPDGIVMHPSDFLRIALLKDAAKGYLIFNPQTGSLGTTLFGKPVVTTTAMTVDKFVVGPFKEATLYDRQQATILLSDSDRDNFIRNKITILAEERVGFAAKRPASFVYGDFGNVS